MILRAIYLFLFLIALGGCASLPSLEQLEKIQADVETRSNVMANHLSSQVNDKDCNNSLLSSTIVNGTSVMMNDPLSKQAVLLLTKRGAKTSSCTAVALAQNILVTAAHCVSGASAEAVTAVFDTSTNCASGATRKVSILAKSIVIHEDYNGTPQSKADLAIIKISAPIPSDYKVGALFDGLSPLSNDEVVMLGYGITDEKKQDSMVLRTTTKSFAKDSYVKGPIIGFNQNNKTGGFCRGDSGAPIYVNSGGSFKIIGINSFNIGKTKDKECQTASVGMYTPHFKNWIIAQVLKL